MTTVSSKRNSPVSALSGGGGKPSLNIRVVVSIVEEELPKKHLVKPRLEAT